MVKSIILLLNMLGFLICGSLFVPYEGIPLGKAKVSQSMPSSPNVFVERTSNFDGSDIKISLVIHKGNISGFGKVEETLPKSSKAIGIDLHGASFTFVDNTAKFVWQHLPADSVINVSYWLIAGSNLTNADSVSGTFSYIYNKVPEMYQIGATILNASSMPSNSMGETNVNPAINNDSITATEPVVNQTQNPSLKSPLKYKVQIMALIHPVSAAYIQKKYGLTSPVNIETTGGFTRYTIGDYNDYKNVRDDRELVKNSGIISPFVVAYNNGNRITVKEALTISHQQWYK